MSSRPPRRLLGDVVAVSAVIGTVLTLVISVAGLGLTMLIGAPMMQRMDDQAAIEAAVGRFDALQDAVWRLAVSHEALSVPMDPLGGTLAIEDGTRTLISLGLREGRLSGGGADPCQVKLKSWADGDNLTELQTSTCKAPQKRGADQTEGRGNPHTGGDTETCETKKNGDVKCKKVHNSNGNKGGKKGTGANCGQNANSACLQAYAIPDYGVDHIVNITTQGGRLVVELDQAMEGSEWLFELTSEVGIFDMTDPDDPIPIEPTVYAQVWVLDQAKLHWSRPGPNGGVDAVMEGGTMFSSAGLLDRMESPLPLAEDGAGDGTYFLRLVTMRADGFGPGSSATSAQLMLSLSDGFIRARYNQDPTNATDGVDTLRFGFAGTLGDAWCAALLQRNGGFGMPEGFSYSADNPCITGDSSDSGVRNILYSRLDEQPFAVVFSEVVLDVKLQP